MHSALQGARCLHHHLWINQCNMDSLPAWIRRINIFIHIYVYKYIDIYIYIYRHTCMCIYIYMLYTCIYTYCTYIYSIYMVDHGCVCMRSLQYLFPFQMQARLSERKVRNWQYAVPGSFSANTTSMRSFVAVGFLISDGQLQSKFQDQMTPTESTDTDGTYTQSSRITVRFEWYARFVFSTSTAECDMDITWGTPREDYNFAHFLCK